MASYQHPNSFTIYEECMASISEAAWNYYLIQTAKTQPFREPIKALSDYRTEYNYWWRRFKIHHYISIKSPMYKSNS